MLKISARDTQNPSVQLNMVPT